MGAISASLLANPRGGRLLLAVVLVSSTMVNFAFSEFALLLFLGFLTVKLHCYRFVNSFLTIMPYSS